MARATLTAGAVMVLVALILVIGWRVVGNG